MGLAKACLAGWVGSSPEDRSTGDGARLASQGLALVLDLEVADSTRSTSPKPGGPRVDRSNVAGEPTLRHRADPWGTAQARNHVDLIAQERWPALSSLSPRAVPSITAYRSIADRTATTSSYRDRHPLEFNFLRGDAPSPLSDQSGLVRQTGTEASWP